MSFDLKAFVKKSWDTFRGGDTTIGIGQWRPSDGLLALLNKPELVAGLIPHIPEYISDLTTSSTEELSDKANELLGLDPGTLTADNLGVFLGYIRDETPEAFNSVLAELTGTTPLEVFQAVYEYSSKKAVDSLGLDGVPTNTTDPKWYAYFNELQNILGAGGRSREEAAEDYFRQAGYEPSPEELEEILMGDAFPTRTAIEVYVDPRQVTNDEVIERLERVGIDVEGQAEAAGQTPEEYAEQIKQSIPPGDGSEAAFDDAMIMSLTSTAAGGTGSASFKEALSKMGTGVKNLLFGTNSGSPKPWLQILKEQIEKKYFPTFEDQMPGFPLEIVFDLDGASAANPTGALVRANLKIPVPFPVNGPPIVIPLFSENGTYIGPTTPKGLLVDPETGIITQVKEGIEQTVGQIKGEVVQVLGAAGDVIRSFPLGLLENPDWKEGDPNPFELEVDGNGDIAPQTDENGNPATGYAPDTGLPVYEKEEEKKDPETKSPYDSGEASDAFRDSSWPDPDPDAQDTYSRQIEQMFLDYGLDTNQWPEGNSLNITRRDGQPVDANGDGVYTVEELAAVGITPAAGYDPLVFLGNDARLVLNTLEDTLDGLGLDIDDIETILGSIQTDLQNVTTAEDLKTFRTNLIAELTDPDTGLSSMGIDADELATALGTALTGYATTTEVNTAITTAINALDIPTDTVRSDEDIKRIAQGIVDNLDLPEDTQISDEDLTTAISTYLTNNGYITSTRTDEEINTLIGTALTGYATTTEVNTAITTAINALDIPTDTVRSDEDIKRIAQGIVDNLDLPEDTQISDEDLTTAISTYLTNNGYITSTRTDEEINTLIGTALTGYATTTEVNTAITTAINALDIPTDTVRSDEDIKRIAQGIVDNLDLPEDTQISDEDLTTAISTYLTNNGYITSTRTDEEINTLIGTALTGYATTTEVNTAITTAINALDIPTDTVRSDEDIKRIAQGIVDNLDLPEDTQISDEDLSAAISTYLTDNGYINVDDSRTDEEINTLIGTALTDYATVKGVQDTIDTYFGADGSVTKTLTALGFDTDEIKNIIGTPSNYTDPITKEVTKEATGMYALVEGAATPQDIIDAVGAPTTNESGEVIGGTGLYGDLFTLGVDVERIEGAIGNKDEGTGLYGYIDAAVQDLATVDDVERIVGVPDFIEGTDEDGNPTRELTDKSTGLYLDFYNAGVDYDTVINLIGVPDDPSTPDVNEGRGLFGYVGESNEAVKTYIDTLLGDVPGQVTEIQGDVNTLVEYVGSPGADVDDPNTEIDERLPTGLYRTLFNQGVAIDAIPGIIEGIVGVPEYGVDGDGNPTDEIVGGTGLYGEVVSLNTDVDTVIASINNTVIPQITEVAGFIGKPATVDKDGNVIPATGLHKIIEDYAGDSELRDGAITDAINKFTSDGAYTIEQVLTAIDTSNTDIKNFIGSPGADVDDPNTPEDETLPTGIYEGIAISEGRIIDAVSESEDNTNEYLTYISQIIGVPATELTQEDIDTIVGLIGEDEAITEINNDNRLYDVNFDGLINDADIGILQGYIDAGVDGVGEIPATGLYADAARRQFETQGFISYQDDITRGLISDEAKATRGLMGATTLFNAMLGAGDLSGTRVDVTTPDPARINYIYDFEDVFATPQQKNLFPSPYGKPQMAQQQQMAQRQSSTSGPLQIGGMAQGGKVDYDFTDEIMQIMRYGDN
jgi:guanyl-specific ribonuclease Sa